MTTTRKIISKRIVAGEYEVYIAGDSSKWVRVTKVWYPSDGEYWIAAPNFDSNTSDPLSTKRAAMRSARYFLGAA